MSTQDASLEGFSIDPELLISVLDDATVLVDARGDVRRMNPRMGRVMASGEVTRLPFADRAGALRLIGPDGLAEPARGAAHGIRQVLAGDRDRLEIDLGGDGASLFAVACALGGERGALVRIRLRTAEEEHRARCAEVVEKMQLGLHIYRLEDLEDDRTLRCVYSNPAVEAITRLPTSYYVGRLLDEVSSDPRTNGLLATYVEAVRERRSIDTEHRFVDGHGTTNVHAIKAFPLSGQCVGAIFEDVTQQRAMEDSLRSTTKFLDNILDNIPMIIFLKDAQDLRYVHINRAMEERFGTPAEYWLGRTDADLFPGQDAEAFVAADRKVLAQREVMHLEEKVPVGEGHIIAHTRKVPILDEEGRPLFLLGLSEDISLRKEAEDAMRREMVLLEAQKQLLALVRELSTPLLPLSEGILVAPLVGQMDATRGEHFLESLLAGIQRHAAEAVLIDVTGVPSVDAEVAELLLRATRAAGLLGTSCALVGVSPQVARTLIELGVDFGSLRTYANLGTGMAAALSERRKGRASRMS
jgi:PAS domain S-box-containing protein